MRSDLTCLLLDQAMKWGKCPVHCLTQGRHSGSKHSPTKRSETSLKRNCTHHSSSSHLDWSKLARLGQDRIGWNGVVARMPLYTITKNYQLYSIRLEQTAQHNLWVRNGYTKKLGISKKQDAVRLSPPVSSASPRMHDHPNASQRTTPNTVLITWPPHEESIWCINHSHKAPNSRQHSTYTHRDNCAIGEPVRFTLSSTHTTKSPLYNDWTGGTCFLFQYVFCSNMFFVPICFCSTCRISFELHPHNKRFLDIHGSVTAGSTTHRYG